MASKVRLLLVAPLFAGLLLIGCKSSSTPARVEGKVTYKGKPLPSGTITLVGEKGTPVTVAIGEDGSYKLTGLQAGTYNLEILLNGKQVSTKSFQVG